MKNLTGYLLIGMGEFMPTKQNRIHIMGFGFKKIEIVTGV